MNTCCKCESAEAYYTTRAKNVRTNAMIKQSYCQRCYDKCFDIAPSTVYTVGLHEAYFEMSTEEEWPVGEVVSR